jgi:putative selenium metabolism hydrolase
MNTNWEKVVQTAETNRQDIVKFLRDLIAIPSESSQEKRVVQRIGEEMENVGFDRVEIDPMGNVLGYIGKGKHLIAIDAHIDTVGIGDRRLWNFDPYEGFEDEEYVGGRGASDQKGGMASAVYAGKIIKDLDLEGDYTLVVTGTVQEEDCDGLCWQYIINEDNLRPEFVVSTEPTGCRIYRGHRGRMEIKVTTRGMSCHGSAPERGDNAIYKMAPILTELRALHENLKDDAFLGKGTLTVSEVFFTSPSRCAVADSCTISVDRRLTSGEDRDLALSQIRNLPSVKNSEAEVSMYNYSRPAYTGLVYPTESYFPVWTLEEEHPVCKTLADCYKGLFCKDPVIDKWTFSTNGVSIAGMFNIPCIGFGPGREEFSHAPNEKTIKSELVKAAAMYVLIPRIYVDKYAR